MIGEKRKSSVVPPPPPSTAKDGVGVVGGKCAEESDKKNALPPVNQSGKKEEKKLYKTPAKIPPYGYISSGSDDDDIEESEEPEEEEEEKEEENEHNDSQIEDGEAEAEADAGEEEEEESIDKPKLAEGFYLIEAVRDKRIRRGKREYRIKWRGWPESANTWEPMENLKTVPHVIDAYEENLRTKRRKRKRRNSYSFSQTRKRPRKRSSDTAVERTVAAAPLKIIEETIPPAVAADTDTDTVVLNSGVDNDTTERTDLEAGEQLNENGVDLGPSENEGAEIDNNDVIIATDDNEKSPVEQSQVKPQDAQLTGQNAVANGSEKTESGEEALLEAGRSTGARKRKSGPVRRFKLETNSGGADDLEDAALNGVGTTGLDGNQLPENLDSTSKDVGCKETRDTRKNICDITEIIKPIKYTSFMSCNTLDICVTFLVKRSDGKEMTVDNKFLKAHCPVLLLDFYEQRLRY